MVKIMLQTPTTVVKTVVTACLCLHKNPIRMRYPVLDRGQIDAENDAHEIAWRDEVQLEEVKQAVGGGNIDNVAGKRQREYLSMYFCSDAGSVPWQGMMI